MFLVTTALMLEARPIVSRMGLNALPNRPYPLFTNGECLLVVTGTGNLKASAATAWAFGAFPELSAAVNAGFCGASAKEAGIHKWYLVNSIRDASTERLSLPDILLRHPFTEKALLTVPKVLKEDIGWAGLVDMEGSGFYESARKFLPPDRIALLKWVSDELTGSINVDETRVAYEAGLDTATDFIRTWGCTPPVSDPEGATVIGKIQSSLRLTQTQQAFLHKWVQGYLRRAGDEERILSVLPADMPRSKKANTQIFEKLRDVLKS